MKGGKTWPLLAAFAVGAFTIGSQAALLREYMVLFRGSELAVGAFFGCWFGWIALSAWCARRFAGLRAYLARHAGAWVAAYPLSGVAGFLVLPVARIAAGVPPYEPTPPGALLAGAAACTLPVGVITGMLFPAICDLAAGSGEADRASRGYVAESLGAVAGGAVAAVAALLGADGLTLTALLGIVAAAVGGLGAGWRVTCLSAVLCLLILLPPTGPAIRREVAEVRLAANLRGAEFVAERHTPYQLVTTARVGTQTVVLADGAIEAAFPAGPDAEATAALLASEPRGREAALVLGTTGIGAAVALARYFGSVDVVSVDAGEVEALRDAWRASGGSEPAGLRFVEADPRAFLRRPGAAFDLVLVAGSEPRTLLANRLYTEDAFGDAARRLAPGGVVAVPVLSGENAVSPEVLRYGQSVRSTLAAVFADVQVLPGERALMLAGARPGQVTVDADTVAARYLSFAPSPAPFPEKGFATILSPDRAAFVRSLYGADPPGDLVNRDSRPLASFLFLIALLRQSESGGVRVLWAAHQAGPGLAAALVGVLLLVVFRGRLRRGTAGAGYSSGVLVAAAGGASIAASVALLSAFQASVGALYGEVGAASALSMAGLAAGAVAGRALARLGRAGALAYTLAAAAAFASAPVAIDAASGLGPAGARVAFGALFFVAGLVTGAAWSVAAAGMVGPVAASLEAADHRGAAVMAVATAVAIAVLGQDVAFLAMAGVLAVAGAAMGLDALMAGGRRTGLSGSSIAVPAGGVLAFAALAAVTVAYLARGQDDALRTRLSSDELQRLDAHASAREVAAPFDHFRLEGVRDPEGDAVATTTAAVAPDVRGYGGPIDVAISVGTDGLIRRVAIVAHRETPSYVHDLPDFLKRWIGRDVRDVAGPAVDAMTGATVTRDAATLAMERARRAVAGLLGLDAADAAPPAPWTDRLLDPRVWWVLAFLAAAAWVHLRGSDRARLALLAASAVVGGVLLNIQLSATWLLSLFAFDPPRWTSDAPLFLATAGALALAVVWGPAYCAHLCPFGASQELLVRAARRLGLRLGEAPPAWARSAKYVLLAALPLALFASVPADDVQADPLGAAFAGGFGGVGWVIVAIVAAGSLVVFRFWCRLFCPVGAFLNLANRLAGFMPFVPPRRYDRCDLGVVGPADVECLQCNRCTRSPSVAACAAASSGRPLRVGVATLAWLVLAASAAGVIAWSIATRGPGGPAVAATSAPVRTLRDVDVERVRRLMQEGRMSDHEAKWWKPQGP